MSNVNRYLGFVKSQASFHEDRAQKLQSDEPRFKFHAGIAETFHELAEYLEVIKANPPKQPSETKPGTRVLGSELKDLPEELIQELSISDSDRMEHLIVDIIESCSGTVSLDRLLVELYRATGKVHKRQQLNARLYRLSQKGSIYHVPGRKGFYSIHPEDAAPAS